MRTQTELVKLFYKHIIPIGFRCDKTGKPLHTFIVTSFVMSVAGKWFLITAGHCLRDIEANIIGDGYTISQCHLIDYIGLDATHKKPIPFDFLNARYEYCDVEGFDYGIIFITDYYKALLERNNIHPLNEEVWKKQRTKVDFYMLLGVPSELTKIDNNMNVQFMPSMYSVEPIDERPEGFPETDAPVFYGKVIIEGGVSRIEGMSGGPIFGFHEDEKGQLKYWLIALQSSWLPEAHFIKACRTSLFGLFLEEMVVKMKSGQS